MNADDSISLSLVSHTDAGKTTLACTLLGRDVGTVRDAPHVTEFADVNAMIKVQWVLAELEMTLKISATEVYRHSEVSWKLESEAASARLQ